METYEVVVYETVRKTVIVEAAGRNEAMSLGLDIIVKNEPDTYTTTSTGSKTVDCYDHTPKEVN